MASVFRDLDLEFHPRLTVLTGANGAGKTTVLDLLSRHFGWQGTLVSTPRRLSSGTAFSADYWTEDYLKDFEGWLDARFSSKKDEPPAPPPVVGPAQQVGLLTYWNDHSARLTVPATVGASFQMGIDGQEAQRGLHVPSHRPIFSYQTVGNIPTVPRRRDQAFATYTEIVRSQHHGHHDRRAPNIL